MKNLNFFLLVFIPFLAFGQTRTTDSLALVQLYIDLSGPDWTKGENWLSEFPLDDWEGVSINNDRVQHLVLNQFGVVGTFPMSVVELTGLATLEIKGGAIEGSIPGELSALPILNRLILNDCGLTGPLPDNFDQFPALGTCTFTNNNISGELPSMLPSTMTYINWKGNQFTGEIPMTWQGANLSWITMTNNLLEGDFDVLATMPSLSHIDMGNNNWEEASFPEWVDDFANLSWFACESCNLVGDLPLSLDFSERLSHDRVLITDNQLSGDISLLFTGAQSQRGVYLRARNNNFSGEFPAHKVLTANQIDVRGNRYNSISEFGDVAVDRLDISSNDFTFTTLDPIKYYIEVDTIIGMLYDPQSDLLDSDTVIITEPTILTIEAGDEYPGIIYEWYNGNSIIPNEISSTMSIALDENSFNTQYRCKMTHPDFPELTLFRKFFRVEIDFSTSIDEENVLQAITLSPNPASERLYISDADNFRNQEFYIFNSNGIMVQSGAISEQNSIDISDLKNGNYFLKILFDGHSISKNFIKL